MRLALTFIGVLWTLAAFTACCPFGKSEWIAPVDPSGSSIEVQVINQSAAEEAFDLSILSTLGATETVLIRDLVVEGIDDDDFDPALGGDPESMAVRRVPWPPQPVELVIRTHCLGMDQSLRIDRPAGMNCLAVYWYGDRFEARWQEEARLLE